MRRREAKHGKKVRVMTGKMGSLQGKTGKILDSFNERRNSSFLPTLVEIHGQTYGVSHLDLKLVN